MTQQPFNLNNYMWAKMKPLGHEIFRKHWKQYGIDKGLEVEPDGWTKFQAWEFMNIFGEHLGMTFDLPCETEVRFDMAPLF